MKRGKGTVLSNFIWRFMERSGAEIVQFIVSIFLARILEPTDYGTVALMNVFISLLKVFISQSFSVALIQKKDADQLDFSTVFYVQSAFCLVLYLVLFFTAPIIANFYEDPPMTAMIRVLGLTLIISGFKSIQTAYISRNMQFKRFFFATLGGTVGAAFLGIWMAFGGFGVWALIAQSLFNHTVDTIILWVTVKWYPTWEFSFKRLKGLFSYGWKLLASSLLEKSAAELRSLIIGKIYTKADLAYYNRGKSWPSLLVDNINSSIDSVLLPAMSSEQDNRERVKLMTRRSIMVSTFILAPLLMGLAGCGVPLVRIILTEKWLPAVPFQIIFCITSMFYPIHTANLSAIKAMGRSDLFFKLQIIKTSIGLVVLLITVRISVFALACSALFTSVSSQMINSWPNRKLLGYKYSEQLKDILPNILLAMFMGAIVYCVSFLGLNDWLTLVIQIPLGVALYVGGSILFKLESFHYVLGMVKDFLKKRKKKA